MSDNNQYAFLPPGVRAQVEKAQAFLQQQQEQMKQQQTVAIQQPPVAAISIPPIAALTAPFTIETPKDTVVVNNPSAVQQQQSNIQQPQPEQPSPLPTEQQPAAQPVQTPQQIQSYEQQYKTLQGKYAKEVVEVHARNKVLQDELRRLTDEFYAERQKHIVNNQQKPQEPTQTTAPAANLGLPPEAMSSLKDLGEEFSPVIETINRSAQETEALKQQIIAANQSIEALRLERQKEQFLNSVNATVAARGGDVTKMTHNPNFQTWMNEYVPGGRYTRLELFADAESRMDANGVVRFFIEYLDSLPNNFNTSPNQNVFVQDTPAPQPAQVTPQPQPVSAQPEQIMRNIQPPATVFYPATTSPPKPTYTRAMIQNFYSEKAKRLWHGKEAQANAIEADMIAAALEGRVFRR